jgi:metallo-beta-lactamase class B
MSEHKAAAILALASVLAAAKLSAQATPASNSSASAFAQASADWLDPFPAHHVIGNVYYVGSKGLAAFLITTPEGHILINSDLEPSVPQIRENVEKLGFQFTDIKILLISHAHFDHCAGSAKIKELTGAKYMVMDSDVPVVESGGKKDFQYGNRPQAAYPATKVDRVLHDGDEVKLGGAVLVAHKTPGHTRGCTTWTLKTPGAANAAGVGGRLYDVVIVGSPNVNPGYKLVGNTSYPEIAKDYEHAFAVWKALPCDVFLGAHGSYYDLEKKYSQSQHASENAFIDSGGYKAYIAERESAFREELKSQQRQK